MGQLYMENREWMNWTLSEIQPNTTLSATLFCKWFNGNGMVAKLNLNQLQYIFNCKVLV